MIEPHLIPVCLVGVYLLLLPELPRQSHLARGCVVGLIFILGVRYLTWRTLYTVPEVDVYGNPPYWMWICYGQEMVGWIDAFLFFLLLSRTKERHLEANLHENRLRSLSIEQHPTVDLFFTIYNEPLEILEYSIIGAKTIDWPKERLNIWVLDDKKRDEVSDFCEKVGVGYITRDNNIGAKAGNINNALKYTNGQYIAIFDTDFIPHRNFLYRTVGFFDDPKVAVVQTPHSFYNQDIVQKNLRLFDAVPNDQALFFDTIMPSRDAWGVAFFCGSSAVLCRQKITEVGGIPMHTVTEDVLLSIVLCRKDYRSIYLRERLSHGLATESIKDFTVQRRRWALGNLQMIFTKNGVFGKGLTFIQRLFFFPSYWLFMVFIKWIMLLAPVVFLWTNTLLLQATFEDLLFYQMPFLIVVIASMVWLGPWQFIPIVSNAFSIVQMIAIMPAGIRMFFAPHKTKFAVTPKDRSNTGSSYNFPALIICGTLFIASILGLAINLIPEYQIVPVTGFFPVAALWTAVNITTLGIAIMLCFDTKRVRTYDRFPVHQQEDIIINGHHLTVTLIDMSIGGMRLHLPAHADVPKGSRLHITLKDIGEIKSDVVMKHGATIGLNFLEVDEDLRYKLIQFIMTGRFDNAQHQAKVGYLTKKILHRAFGHHHHHT